MLKKLCLSIICLVSVFGFGQMSEGYFQYSIQVEAIDTSLEARQNAQLLHDSKMEIYFASELSRVDFTMGRMYVSTIVIDKISNKAVTLTTGVMGKYAIENTADELDQQDSFQDSNMVIVDMNETKQMLSYNCRKILVKTNGKIITYWVTDEIEINGSLGNFVNMGLPGFPMAFETVENGLRMEYILSNIKFEILDKNTTFSTVIPEGYTIVPTEN